MKVPVLFAGKEYAGDSLTPDEESILRKHLYNYLAYGNSFLYDLLRLNDESIIAAAAVAKEKFGVPFNGMLATDAQFGFQLLRPGHILRTTAATETPQNDWTVTLTADGDYWIGFDTNNTTAINIDKELLVLWLGIAFSGGSQPSLEELYIQVGEVTYAPWVVRNSWFADNTNKIRAARIHPILLAPKDTMLVQSYSIAQTTMEIVCLGLTFGFGRILRKTSYTSVAL